MTAFARHLRCGQAWRDGEPKDKELNPGSANFNTTWNKLLGFLYFYLPKPSILYIKNEATSNNILSDLQRQAKTDFPDSATEQLVTLRGVPEPLWGLWVQADKLSPFRVAQS